MIINLTIRYYIIVIIFCIKLLFYIWFSTFSKATISQTGVSLLSLLLELFSKTRATGTTVLSVRRLAYLFFMICALASFSFVAMSLLLSVTFNSKTYRYSPASAVISALCHKLPLPLLRRIR